MGCRDAIHGWMDGKIHEKQSNNIYKSKICCKNQRETVKGSEQIWRKLKLIDSDWRWE